MAKIAVVLTCARSGRRPRARRRLRRRQAGIGGVCGLPDQRPALARLRRGLGVVPQRRLRPAGRDRGDFGHRQLRRSAGARGADGLLVDEAQPGCGNAVGADRCGDDGSRHHRDRGQGGRGHGVPDARHRAQRAEQRGLDDAVDADERPLPRERARRSCRASPRAEGTRCCSCPPGRTPAGTLSPGGSRSARWRTSCGRSTSRPRRSCGRALSWPAGRCGRSSARAWRRCSRPASRRIASGS